MRKTLLLAAGLFCSAVSFAQGTFNDFVKSANFLKDSKKNGGYYANSGTPIEYNVHGVEHTFEIFNVQRENGNVVAFTINFGQIIANQVVKPNDPVAPTYWKPLNTNEPLMVMYKDYIVILTDDPASPKGFEIDGWHVLGPLSIKEKIKAEMDYQKKAIKPPFTKEEIVEAMKPFVDAKKNALATAAADLKAKQDAHRAKYSIKDKNVSKLEIVHTSPANLSHLSAFSFGVAATLADGTVIKTKNIGGEGYIEDYNIVIGGDCTLDYDGLYKVGTNASKFAGDYIKIDVSSKHHLSLKKAELKLVLNYSAPITLKFNGSSSYANGVGAPGKNIKVEVRHKKHSETGETLVEYRIFNDAGELIHTVRMLPTQKMMVMCNGGNGAPDEKRNGLDGGDGGNITVFVDTKVGNNYFFEYSNTGGKGGKSNTYKNGIDGRDGKYSLKVLDLN